MYPNLLKRTVLSSMVAMTLSAPALAQLHIAIPLDTLNYNSTISGGSGGGGGDVGPIPSLPDDGRDREIVDVGSSEDEGELDYLWGRDNLGIIYCQKVEPGEGNGGENHSFGGKEYFAAISKYDIGHFAESACTSGISDMSSISFKGDNASFNGDISHWDTSNVTDMGSMFRNATSFNQDLSGWCVSKIASKPSGFDLSTSAWDKTDRQPIWGTCPAP